MKRPEKITLGAMRSSGVRGVLVYCSDYRCSHSITLSADRWSLFSCKECGKRGADVRPDFNWDKKPARAGSQ